MLEFEYLRPLSLGEACDLLSRHGGCAKVMAGGTDLVVALREENLRLKGLQYVMDLSHIPELAYIREEEGTIRIGALATHAQVAVSPAIRRHAHLLAQACSQVGSPQVRNRGTLAGNIANASPAADTVPALVALQARVTLMSSRGSRELSVAEVLAGPYRTNLAADEIIAGISFKKLPPSAGSAFLKIGRRWAMSIARLNVAVVIDLDEGCVVREARIVPGGALPVAAKLPAVEEMVRGQVLTEGLAQAAGEKAGQEMVGLSGIRWSTEYKLPVLAVLVRRSILQAGGLMQ